MADEKENMTESAEPETSEGAPEPTSSEPETPEGASEPTSSEPETPEGASEADAEPLAAEAEPAADPGEQAPAEPVAEAETTQASPEAETTEVASGETPEGASRKKKRLPRSERRQRTKPKREQAAERKPITRLPKPEHTRGRRQERQGTVVSAAADKTIVVRVDVVKVHPTYKKVIRRSTKFHAHDERNEAKPGDVVRIVETRPLSKLKRWRLQKIVEAAK